MSRNCSTWSPTRPNSPTSLPILPSPPCLPAWMPLSATSPTRRRSTVAPRRINWCGPARLAELRRDRSTAEVGGPSPARRSSPAADVADHEALLALWRRQRLMIHRVTSQPAAVLRSALDLAGLQARGADVEPLPGSGDDRPYRLDVGVPATRGPAMRVRDRVAEARALAADIAGGSHGRLLECGSSVRTVEQDMPAQLWRRQPRQHTGWTSCDPNRVAIRRRRRSGRRSWRVLS